MPRKDTHTESSHTTKHIERYRIERGIERETPNRETQRETHIKRHRERHRERHTYREKHALEKDTHMGQPNIDRASSMRSKGDGILKSIS